MNKMERTNHGRGSTLTMGLANMYVCVLLEFIERLYAGINGFIVCVLLEFVERLYAGIDGFNVCILLELSDSLYVGLLQHVYVCVFMSDCVLCSEFAIRCQRSVV